MTVPKRGDVYTVQLNPAVGREIRKARPCVIVSPDAMSRLLDTVLVAPLTTTIKRWPTRVPVVVEDRSGSIVLDQIRSVDRSRRKLRGQVDWLPALAVVQAMFAP